MKKVLPFIIFTFLFHLSVTNSNAAIVKVNSDGSTTLNVLSYEDSEAGSQIEIQAEDVVPGKLAVVSLSKVGDSKFNLAINKNGVSQNLNVENLNEDIVEIEERPKVKKMTISVEDNKFALKQRNITAVTEFPLTVNSETAEMTADTTTGEKNIVIFPFDAVETLTRSRLITNVKDNKVELVEEEEKLIYKINGEKVFTILNFYDYKVPITTKVSATTGEIYSVDTPSWLRFVNIFFS